MDSIVLQDLLDQNDRKHKLEKEIFCGLHSGIPFCCILWYLGNHYEFSLYINEITQVYRTTIDEETVLLPFWERDNIWFYGISEYVPCPECMVKLVEGKRKPIKITRCSCNYKAG